MLRKQFVAFVASGLLLSSAPTGAIDDPPPGPFTDPAFTVCVPQWPGDPGFYQPAPPWPRDPGIVATPHAAPSGIESMNGIRPRC